MYFETQHGVCYRATAVFNGVTELVYWSTAVPSSADTQGVVCGCGLSYSPRAHGVPAWEGCGGG